ncbi:MAG: HD-GYP domain-containing protein, partial [bacterium]
GLAAIKPVRLPSGAYLSASSAIVVAAAIIGGPLYAVLFGLAAIAWALIQNPETALARSIATQNNSNCAHHKSQANIANRENNQAYNNQQNFHSDRSYPLDSIDTHKSSVGKQTANHRSKEHSHQTPDLTHQTLDSSHRAATCLLTESPNPAILAACTQEKATTKDPGSHDKSTHQSTYQSCATYTCKSSQGSNTEAKHTSTYKSNDAQEINQYLHDQLSAASSENSLNTNPLNPEIAPNGINPTNSNNLNGGITSLIKTKALATKLSPATSYGFVLIIAGSAASAANWLAARIALTLHLPSALLDLVPFLFATGTFYLIETILACLLLSKDGLSPLRLWQRNYLKVFPEPLSYAASGYAIFLGYRMLGLWATLPLFLFPTLWRHLALLRRSELLRIRDSLIRAAARTIDEKDRYTGGHSGSVVELSVAIAREMKLNERFVEELEEAAIRHDLGKVSWPNQVLRKPASFDREEEETYKQTHPDFSAEIARRAGSSERVCEMIRHHHERWDGKGYPHGIKGKEIPLGARILCVADSFDAMIHDRWYRRKRTTQDAIDELLRCRGTQFDPEVVDAFLSILSRIDADELLRTIETDVHITPPEQIDSLDMEEKKEPVGASAGDWSGRDQPQ